MVQAPRPKKKITWAKEIVRVHHVESKKKWNYKQFNELCKNLSYFQDGIKNDLPPFDDEDRDDSDFKL